MHRDFLGKEKSEDLLSALFSIDSDTALILSVMLLLKKEGKHDILLPLLLYILM